MEDILGSAKDFVTAHWSFMTISIVLGIFGNFAKARVWTKERAATGSPHWLWWWGRASLPIHAPVAGIFVGLILILIFKDKVPAGPGITTHGEVCLYYMGSGVVSSWVYNIAKHYAESKGIVIDPVLMPDDSDPPTA